MGVTPPVNNPDDEKVIKAFIEYLIAEELLINDSEESMTDRMQQHTEWFFGQYASERAASVPSAMQTHEFLRRAAKEGDLVVSMPDPKHEGYYILSVIKLPPDNAFSMQSAATGRFSSGQPNTSALPQEEESHEMSFREGQKVYFYGYPDIIGTVTFAHDDKVHVTWPEGNRENLKDDRWNPFVLRHYVNPSTY